MADNVSIREKHKKRSCPLVQHLSLWLSMEKSPKLRGIQHIVTSGTRFLYRV
nr:MAG TPA: hypothetical protein [Caudoviricetes sp.]